ncbi:hypothetical protein BDW74DRAFT_186112 [Aspergillus multicolor]|uniref:uncharacterized protein n=1 Tax=Aspergillus multicolor TaxID=41759 RepID=UPI003CCDB567
MQYRPMSPKRGGAWTKVVIFVSLYNLLLQSLIEWVVVLYLYANKHVDSKMAPSLIFALAASFLTVPLVILHSFLAWQYNRVLGYATQKAVLHTVCTYVMRSTTIVWLGASVAGLVVVSQQAYCFPDGSSGSFWNVGVSCALHRAVVIVSVLAFLTICLYFCSRELCERPYDVSLLGVYRPQRSSRDGSILSASTLNSEKGLKRDIICVCRHPDITYGRAPYITPNEDSEDLKSSPSIRQPAPRRPTSFPRFSPDSGAESDYLSGTTVTLGAHSDLQSISRTPSSATAQDSSQPQNIPELPAAALRPQSTHTRNQSSLSSLRRFLPKSLPASAPLSSDPQIRALAEASAQVDVEKQEPQREGSVEELTATKPPTESPQPPPKDESSPLSPQISKPSAIPSLPRSATMNSAEAPEVVTLSPAPAPIPITIRRSSTAQSFSLPPPINPNPNTTSRPWSTLLDPTQHNPLRMNSNTMRVPRRHSQSQTQDQHHFGAPPIPRYTQSHRFPGPGGQNRYSRQLRRNVTDVQYQTQHRSQQQGLRRPRSSTFGNRSVASMPGHLDCIRETGASFDELPASDGRIPARTHHY